MGLIHPAMAGGIYVAERRLLDELTGRGEFDVAVFLYGSRRENESTTSKMFRMIPDLASFAKAVARHHPDLIQLNSALNRPALARDIWYLILAKMFAVPMFVKYHGADVRVVRTKAWFWRKVLSLTLRLSAGIGLLSTEEREAFAAAGLDTRKIAVVKNAVDVDRFSGDADRDQSCPHALFISRFVQTKGLLETIQAVRIVIDGGRKISLWCVGDGPACGEAKSLVGALGLGDAVVFTGRLSEAETTRYYRGADLLIFPTYHQEGFPMTLFQSLAAGLPVITTKIRAAADYMAEPDNCLWTEPRNPAMLAERIASLLDNDRLRASMSRNNRLLAARFNAAAVADEYQELFARLTSASSTVLSS